MKINNPSDPVDSAYLKVLIYGPPGIGKTTYGLTAPKPLLLDCDQGIRRVQPNERKHFVTVTSWSDAEEVVAQKDLDFETIVLDTAGKALELLSSDIIKTARPGMKLEWQGNLTQQGYGVLKNRFKMFLHHASQMKKHLVFVAHDKETSDGDIKSTRPDIQGASQSILMREMDLVGFMSVVDGKTVITFDPTERYYGKNTCLLPNRIVCKDTKLESIFETYRANQEKIAAVAIEYAEILAKARILLDAMQPSNMPATGKLLKELPQIWDSKLQASQMFWAKVDELGYQWNGKDFVVQQTIPLPTN